MDFFQKLLGYKEPTLIVAKSQTWIDLPVSQALDAAMSKRARKEAWEKNAEDAQSFYCLLRVEGPFSQAQLVVESLGTTIAVLDRKLAGDTIELMRADNGLRVSAVEALACLDAAGHWNVRLNI